jgi:hypothetical protein
MGPRFARRAVARLESIVAAQGDETFGLDPVAPPQDPGDQDASIVIADPGRNPTQARERDDVALEKRLLAFGPEGDVDRDARVGEPELGRPPPASARRR